MIAKQCYLRLATPEELGMKPEDIEENVQYYTHVNKHRKKVYKKNDEIVYTIPE